MSNTPFFNIHTHHPRGTPDLVEIESLSFGQESTHVAKYYSVGLHPWFLSTPELDMATDWLCQQAGHPNVIAIGEAGLDKVTDTPWPLQMDAFQRCVDLSESSQKPLVIHCVRAVAEIIALKKQWKPAQPWVFHGFDKNLQTAEMLLQEGSFLSFGTALFRIKSHTASVLSQIPAQKFFLETDDAAFSMEEIYQRAAELRGISLETLVALQSENFQNVFQIL